MIAAVILAGGRGLRLGGVDKAFIRLGGRPLIEHAIATLAPQVDRLAISAAGDASRFAAYNLPVLSDMHPGRGPLCGIAAGLFWARDQGADWLASLPVDTPFAPTSLISRLLPGPAAAAHGGRQHHLVALWPVAFLASLEAFLAGPGPYRVRDALSLAGARSVPFAQAQDPFLNINNPDDLAAAHQRLADG